MDKKLENRINALEKECRILNGLVYKLLGCSDVKMKDYVEVLHKNNYRAKIEMEDTNEFKKRAI